MKIRLRRNKTKIKELVEILRELLMRIKLRRNKTNTVNLA